MNQIFNWNFFRQTKHASAAEIIVNSERLIDKIRNTKRVGFSTNLIRSPYLFILVRIRLNLYEEIINEIRYWQWQFFDKPIFCDIDIWSVVDEKIDLDYRGLQRKKSIVFSYWTDDILSSEDTYSSSGAWSLSLSLSLVSLPFDIEIYNKISHSHTEPTVRTKYVCK